MAKTAPTNEEVGLSVKSPNGRYFTVKVTSLSRPNAWIIPDQENQNGYFVLAFKPEGETPAFFVLNQNEMRKEKQLHQDAMKYSVSEYSNPGLELKGLGFKQPFGYSDKWDSLPK